MKKIFLVVIVLMFTATAFAGEAEYWKSRPVTKLKRGSVNVATGALEIPKELKKHWDEGGTNPIKKTAYLFGGFVKGSAYAIGRIGSGLWDIFTLNIDVPGNSEPLMKPDYVWSSDKD